MTQPAVPPAVLGTRRPDRRIAVLLAIALATTGLLVGFVWLTKPPGPTIARGLPVPEFSGGAVDNSSIGRACCDRSSWAPSPTPTSSVSSPRSPEARDRGRGPGRAGRRGHRPREALRRPAGRRRRLVPGRRRRDRRPPRPERGGQDDDGRDRRGLPSARRRLRLGPRGGPAASGSRRPGAGRADAPGRRRDRPADDRLRSRAAAWALPRPTARSG